jgi:hypothetical protein
MRLAYIISAYKYPEQLIRLVDRLTTPATSFFVHVDKKTDARTFGLMAEGLGRRSNVVLLRRHVCEWGGFGHVDASLEGIRAVLASATDPDYAILLTGQDYPIKSNAYIASFLERHRGRLFLEYFPVPYPAWQNGGMDRLASWHWRVRGRHIVVRPRAWLPLKRRIPGNVRPFGGSSYWCLTRESIDYVHDYARSNPSFVRFFRHVDVPDELFFQTIILNSPFAEAAVNDSLRYIEWNDPRSGSPAILTSAQIERLASSPQLFARKFDPTVDAGVLDHIDRRLLMADKEPA